MHQEQYTGLHVTTNFHVIKKWLESRKGIPAALTVGNDRTPAVAFGDADCPGWEEISWGEFFDLMIVHELAFAYEEVCEDEYAGRYFKFVPWAKYPDEIKIEAKQEDELMLAQTAFS